MGQIKPHVDHNYLKKAEAILEGGMQEFWHTMLQRVWIESRSPQGIESNGLQPFSR